MMLISRTSSNTTSISGWYWSNEGARNIGDFWKAGSLEADITRLIGDLSASLNDVNTAAEDAAKAAAEVIREEQKRLLAKKHPQLTKLIGIRSTTTGKNKRKIYVGYDAATVTEHPELVIIEFGRPGKSPRRAGKKDTLGRKKGYFPTSISHIRAGAMLAAEKAAKAYNDKLYELLKKRFRG